jgi:hypothetical protein
LLNFLTTCFLFPSPTNLVPSPTPLQPHTRKTNNQQLHKIHNLCHCCHKLHKSDPNPVNDKRQNITWFSTLKLRQLTSFSHWKP